MAEAEALFGRMLDGGMPDAEIVETLLALTERGETSEEIAGAAKALRARMIPVQAPPGAIDVCGTGGDGHHSLNVSTAVAIIVAACGVPVAKHGNRAASSKAGAADTLEALGLDMARAGETAEATLNELGICFLFATTHHPAMKRIQPIRKAIGRRTIFNLMGPLANPARVTRQLIGIARPVSPGDAGLPAAPTSAIHGGDAAYNAAALRRLLQGEEGPYRDAVLLNASAALIVAGRVGNWRDGVEEAAEVLDNGLANALLDCWIAF